MTTTDSVPEHSAPLSRSFHFFLWTRMLSTAANQILLVSLGWQMYDLTASAWDLGLVGLFQFVPTVLLTLPSGHLADRGEVVHLPAQRHEENLVGRGGQH